MNKMSKRTFIPLFINAVLLLFLITVIGLKNRDAFGFKPLFREMDNVDPYEIHLSGQLSWIYKKEGNEWFLYKDDKIRIPVKKQGINRIIDTIKSISSSKPAAINLENSEVWGLTDNQALTVQVIDSSGKKLNQFRLGLPLGDKESCFLQIPGDNRVFKVPVSLLDLTKESNLSERRLFPTIQDLDEIQRYSIKIPAKSTQLSYTILRKSGKWILYGSENTELNQEKVSQVIMESALLMTDGFLVREPDINYGFENPSVIVTLETLQGDIYKLSLGGLYGRRAFYAQAESLFKDEKSAVYLIPVSNLEKSLLPKAQLLLQK